jgi:hypothetical protein
MAACEAVLLSYSCICTSHPPQCVIFERIFFKFSDYSSTPDPPLSRPPEKAMSLQYTFLGQGCFRKGKKLSFLLLITMQLL